MISARLAPLRLTWHRLRRPAEPSTVLFHRIRWRLTIWYTAILAATLLLLGVALYREVSTNLLRPVQSGLRSAAQTRAAFWVMFPDNPCPDRGGADATLMACFDRSGNLVGLNGIASEVPAFTESSVALAGLRSGQATDTIYIQRLGSVERYSLRVVDPRYGTVIGVVVVGALISDRVNALHTLLDFLLLFGVVGLVFAAGGGLFLASRSLQPARFAYMRQRDFISDASHELRTPLTLVRTDADVLLRERAKLTTDQVEILEDIVLETSHMAALADSMLDLARLDAGREHFENDVVDLVELAAAIARRSSRLATDHDVQMVAEAGDPILVVADRTLIEQIVLVLVDNAIKYNRPSGEVVLAAHRDGAWAILEVRDTGIGMAPDAVARMGERFFRVDKARSRASGGAGLGVAIAQAIAARLGGNLEIRSEAGKGTTASLNLRNAGSPRI